MFEDFVLEVELVNENAKVPTRGTLESAGLDFYTPVNIKIEPRKDILIPLGLKVKFTKGYQLRFDEKSGIAVKKKLDIGAKIIDSDYRGEIHLHFFNNSDDIVEFNKGDKVVQGIITPVWLGSPIQVNNIDTNTERGIGGFGSTGN